MTDSPSYTTASFFHYLSALSLTIKAVLILPTFRRQTIILSKYSKLQNYPTSTASIPRRGGASLPDWEGAVGGGFSPLTRAHCSAALEQAALITEHIIDGWGRAVWYCMTIQTGRGKHRTGTPVYTGKQCESVV